MIDLTHIKELPITCRLTDILTSSPKFNISGYAIPGFTYIWGSMFFTPEQQPTDVAVVPQISDYRYTIKKRQIEVGVSQAKIEIFKNKLDINSDIGNNDHLYFFCLVHLILIELFSQIPEENIQNVITRLISQYELAKGRQIIESAKDIYANDSLLYCAILIINQFTDIKISNDNIATPSGFPLPISRLSPIQKYNQQKMIDQEVGSINNTISNQSLADILSSPLFIGSISDDIVDDVITELTFETTIGALRRQNIYLETIYNIPNNITLEGGDIIYATICETEFVPKTPATSATYFTCKCNEKYEPEVVEGGDGSGDDVTPNGCKNCMMTENVDVFDYDYLSSEVESIFNYLPLNSSNSLQDNYIQYRDMPLSSLKKAKDIYYKWLYSYCSSTFSIPDTGILKMAEYLFTHGYKNNGYHNFYVRFLCHSVSQFESIYPNFFSGCSSIGDKMIRLLALVFYIAETEKGWISKEIIDGSNCYRTPTDHSEYVTFESLHSGLQAIINSKGLDRKPYREAYGFINLLGRHWLGPITSIWIPGISPTSSSLKSLVRDSSEFKYFWNNAQRYNLFVPPMSMFEGNLIGKLDEYFENPIVSCPLNLAYIMFHGQHGGKLATLDPVYVSNCFPWYMIILRPANLTRSRNGSQLDYNASKTDLQNIAARIYAGYKNPTEIYLRNINRAMNVMKNQYSVDKIICDIQGAFSAIEQIDEVYSIMSAIDKPALETWYANFFTNPLP